MLLAFQWGIGPAGCSARLRSLLLADWMQPSDGNFVMAISIYVVAP